MPQTTRRGVAPLNPQPRWPGEYITELREAGAQEKNIPHCVAWVRRFFAKHPGRKHRDLGRTEIEAFLAEPVQELLGHSDVKTTMIYTHVLNKGPMGVVSPVDTL